LRSEEIIRAISEFSANSICILNTAGKVIWVNDAVVKMTEYAFGTGLFDRILYYFLAPESLDFVSANFTLFVNNEPYEQHYQSSFIRSDGENRICEKHMTHFAVRNSNFNLITSMIEITDHFLSEQALHTNWQ
jgi:PAS domain S-box-containing protein